MAVAIDMVTVSKILPLEVVKFVPAEARHRYPTDCYEYLVPPRRFWETVQVPVDLRDEYVLGRRDPLALHGVRYRYLTDGVVAWLNPICEIEKDVDTKFIFYSYLTQDTINRRGRKQRWWERLLYRSTLNWLLSLYTVVEVRKIIGNQYVNITRDDFRWLGIRPPSPEACLGNF